MQVDSNYFLRYCRYMRQASQINAERRNREKTAQILVRFYDDRPEDVALLEWLDRYRGGSRADAVKRLLAVLMEADDTE